MWQHVSAVLVGAIVGSFLTTVVERLPQGASFLRGRSRCPYCRGELAARDLVPVVSFVLSRGRCRHCKAPIPRWHLIVEIATIALFVLSVALAPDRPPFEYILQWVMLALLIALTIIDFHHFILPDELVGLLAAAGLVRSVAFGEPGVVSSLLGGLLGVLALGILAVVPWPSFQHPASSIQHPRSAMGLGDAKLAGAMGITLGLQGLLAALFAAFVFGGFVSVLLVLGKRATLKSRVPFGPFLAGATALLLLVPSLVPRFFRFLGFD